MRASLAGGLLTCVAVFVCRAPAQAGCIDQIDPLELATSSRQYLDCAQQRFLVAGAPSCAPPALPACAVVALDELVELTLGGMPEQAVAAAGAQREVACQLAIVREALRYLRLRVPGLLEGRRRVPRSLRSSLVASSCRGTVVKNAGLAVPRLGGLCSATLGPPGSPVSHERLGRCLRAALEGIAGSVVSGRIAPNVVVILTDDQRVDTMAAMPRTVEVLAEQGVTFENAFVAQSLCQPSRSNFLAGRWSHNTGITDNSGSDRFDHANAMPAWLQNAGYVTGMFGKFMNDVGLLPNAPPGWSEWQVISGPAGQIYHGPVYYNITLNENGVLRQYGSDPADYSTDLLRRRVMDFIRKNASKPFFAMFATAAPHNVPVPAPRHLGIYASIAPWRPPNYREPDVSLKPTWVKAYKAFATAATAAALDTRRIRELETLRAVDDAVLRIDQLLQRLGLGDNTVFIFTSDNGISWGEHWTPTKFNSYEQSIRVPLLMRYPVLAPEPSRRGQLVSSIDVAPTIAELAGTTPSIPIDGRSLVPIIESDAAGRDAILVENSGEFFTQPNESVRTAQWKYIITYPQSGGTEEELYDLVADPYELANLAFDPTYADTVTELRDRLAELKAE